MISPQVMIVTGGGRGIGAATARLAAQRGYAVCVNYLGNTETAGTVVGDIESAGGRGLAVKANVADEAEVERLFATVDRELGRVTALVNNAGLAGHIDRLDAAPSETIRERSERFIASLGDTAPLELAILATTSRIGGGAAVDAEIASYAITIVDPSTPAQRIVAALRAHQPPVIARIVDGRVFIDLRTVAEKDENALRAAITTLKV